MNPDFANFDSIACTDVRSSWALVLSFPEIAALMALSAVLVLECLTLLLRVLLIVCLALFLADLWFAKIFSYL
jgi:hypothetical protein